MNITESRAKAKTMVWKGKLAPTFEFPCTRPEPMMSAACRRVVEHFLETGRSTHSAQGATLWALLDFLQRAQFPYVLRAIPGQGYEVVRDPHLEALAETL